MKKITNDLPENKVKNHFSSKQYDKVIKAVESISDNQRTPLLYLLRAKSRYELLDSKSSRTGSEISHVFADFRKAIELSSDMGVIEEVISFLELAFNFNLCPFSSSGKKISFDNGKMLFLPTISTTSGIPWLIMRELHALLLEYQARTNTPSQVLYKIALYYYQYNKYALYEEPALRKEAIHTAYDFVLKCFESNNTDDVLWLLIEIEHILGLYSEAITHAELAFTQSHDAEFKQKKALFLIEIKQYADALDILDDLCKIYRIPLSPKDEEPDVSNPFYMKFRVYQETEDYVSLVLLVKHIIKQKLPVDCLDQLLHLFQVGKSELVLKYFPLLKANQVVKWFIFWGHVYKQDWVTAYSVLIKLNPKKLFCVPFENEFSERKRLFLRNKLVVDYELAKYFSIARFRFMPDLLFIAFIMFIFNEVGFEQFEKYSQAVDSNPGARLSKRIELLHSLPLCVDSISNASITIMQLIQFQLQKEIEIETEERLAVEKTNERNRILSNLSHSIKNILRSIIDPLQNLKDELPGKAAVIDNALKGANLIREMVNSINLSYKTSLEDLMWDIKHPGADSMTLQDMIAGSLQYSIGNMFDFRYYPAFAENYYPRSLKKQDYDRVTEQWSMVTNQTTIETLTSFADKHMFKLSVDLTDTAQYQIGNEKSSAIKLLILFQEIIFNAVKYASYVPRANRFIEIVLSEHDSKLQLQISNSFRPEVQAKTTGVGKLVIENYAKVLDCIPVITTDKNVYSITMEFNNIWRNNA